MAYFPASTAAVYMAMPLSVTPSVVMTDEACTAMDATNTSFRITSAAHSVIDDTQTVTVKVAGTPTTPAAINYAAGVVIFATTQAGAVTVTGKYLPVVMVAKCTGATFTQTADLFEVTAIDETVKSYVPLLGDGTVSFDRWFTEDYTTTNALIGNRLVIILYPSASLQNRVAGFGYIKSDSLKAAKGTILSKSVQIQCDKGLFRA